MTTEYYLLLAAWLILGLLILAIGSLNNMFTGSYMNMIICPILGPFTLVIYLSHWLHTKYPNHWLFRDRLFIYTLASVVIAISLSSCGSKCHYTPEFVQYSAQFTVRNDSIAIKNSNGSIYELKTTNEGMLYVLVNE